MRVPDDIGSGHAQITLTYPDWKAGNVRATSFQVPIIIPEAPESERLLATLAGHPDWVTSVAFSPNGKRLVVGCNDGTIVLWDIAAGKRLKTLQQARRDSVTGWLGGVRSLTFSPDGKQVAAAWMHFRTEPNDDIIKQWIGDVRLWDVITGEALITLKGVRGAAIKNIFFSPDGQKLAGRELWMKQSGGPSDSRLRIWDLATGTVRTPLKDYGREHNFNAAFSSDGQLLVAVRESSRIRIWNAMTGEDMTRIAVPDADVRWLRFSPDKKRLLVSSAGAIQHWEVRTGAYQGSLLEQPIARSHFILSPKADTLAALERRDWEDREPGEILLWNLKKSEPPIVLQGHQGPVYTHALAFSPDGKLLASGSLDRTARIWKVEP